MTHQTQRPCVLFDLDDTLLNHRQTADRAALAFFQHFAELLGAEQREFLTRWHEVTETAMAAFSRGELSVEDQRRARMRSLFGDQELPDRAADARYSVYKDAYFEHVSLFADARPCLDALHEHRVAMITNGGAVAQARKLKHTKLEGYFEFVLTPGDGVIGKPAPELFMQAARRLDIAPEHCIYVGDKLDTDARAAEAVGMRGVWLDRRGGDTDCEVERIQDLDALLRLVRAVHS